MTTITVEERVLIREGFARLMSDQCDEDAVRRNMASEAGYNSALWKTMCEMGIAGLIVDPEYGGIGAGPIELEMIMEEAGSTLFSGPLLSSAVLASGFISASDDDDAKARILPRLSSGEQLATVAMTGDNGGWRAEDIAVEASCVNGKWTLDGVASFVLFSSIADIFLVVANTPDGPAGFEISSGAAGISAEPLESWDPALRLSRITFSGATARMLQGAGADVIEQTLDLARVALAGEQAGAARRIFDLTIDYIKSRFQFGRPVGGFQAIKHMAADLLIEVESATSAARAAAEALASDAPDKDVLVNLAAFACADAFSQVAATSIQMHGGIAFTWEHSAHLYLRRARADAQIFGNSDFYRERYVAALEEAA